MESIHFRRVRSACMILFVCNPPKKCFIIKCVASQTQKDMERMLLLQVSVRWAGGAFLIIKPREKEAKGGKEKIKGKALVSCCQSSLSLSWHRRSSTSASFHLHLVLVLTVLWFNTDRMWKVTLMEKNMGLFPSFLVFFLSCVPFSSSSFTQQVTHLKLVLLKVCVS